MTDPTPKAVEALKPCPFCGSLPEVIRPMGDWSPQGYGPSKYRYACLGKGCVLMTKAWPTEAKARRQWQSRLGAEAAEAEVERLRFDLKCKQAIVDVLGTEVERLRAADQWQPIETAPKDAGPILVRVWPGCTEVAIWADGGWHDQNINEAFDATHWCPLPQPPEDTK